MGEVTDTVLAMDEQNRMKSWNMQHGDIHVYAAGQ
jgi:hypothetical protein